MDRYVLLEVGLRFPLLGSSRGGYPDRCGKCKRMSLATSREVFARTGSLILSKGCTGPRHGGFAVPEPSVV